MVSDLPKPMANEANMVDGKSVSKKSFPNKKNLGKIPKKIHKAEREKLKRDQMNELFIDLGNALEPSCQNSGKASMLGDATRLLRDLLKQVECLRKENSALLTESHYIAEEKNELRDEKIILKADIKKLRKDLQERIHSGAMLTHSNDPTAVLTVGNDAPAQSPHAKSALASQETHVNLPPAGAHAMPLRSPPPPVMGPVFVFPLNPDLQACQELNATTEHASKSQVRRPHARYPTPLDSWPSQFLANQRITGLEANFNSSNSNIGEEGLGCVEACHGLVEHEQ